MTAPVLMRLAVRALSICTLWLVCLAGSARAQQPPGGGQSPQPSVQEKQLAMSKFNEGSTAFSQGRYKDAIDLFLEADHIIQHPAFAYNAALAYEAMGDPANALSWAREYLRRAPHAADRADVDKRIASYEEKLTAKGLQQATVRSEPPGATLFIDGRPLGVTPWTGELAPGPHVLRLELRGHEDAKRSFDLDAMRALEVNLKLEPAAPEPGGPVAAPAPASSSAPEQPAVSEGGVSPWPFVILGVGAAGLGAALGIEAARAGAEQDARDAPTQLEAVDHIDSMNSYQTASRVVAGVAAAVTVVGAVWLTVDLASGGPQSEAEARLAIGCDSATCGLSLRGAF